MSQPVAAWQSANQGTIIVFARAPCAGRTKTRLIPLLGAQGAAELYVALLKRTLTAAARTNANVRLCCTPSTRHPVLRSLAARHGARLCLQRGVDLGMRMHRALNQASRGGQPTLLIGSDCPGFTVGYLRKALVMLARHDVVLGPAEDGGYVLIGCRSPIPEAFAHIDWGSATVLAQTLVALKNKRVGLLPPLWDVDRPGDVVRLGNLPRFRKFVINVTLARAASSTIST